MTGASALPPTLPETPPHDCPRCPRLAAFHAANRITFPDFHNGPVASFGPLDARLLIVGLAPGLKGANRTGRPFTGDYAGDLLYPTLAAHGFAQGTYDARADDGLELVDCRITNAVRCVPPQNKPTGKEPANCRPFLSAEIAAMAATDRLHTVLALGVVAHGAVLAALGLRQNHCKFTHGGRHKLPGGLTLADSYHCSRYNTNTRRLTEAMFGAVFAGVRAGLG